MTPTVMITGAAGALGRHVVQAFQAEGARLLLVDLDTARLDAAFGPETDTRLHAAAAALPAAVARAGRVDALAHTAGGFRMGEAVHEAGDDVWHTMWTLNLGAFLAAVRAVVPGMIERRHGRIVSVGALSSRQGLPGMAPYLAAKDALLRTSEAMAAELKPHGIRVNCVLPSTLDTPANRASMPQADPSEWVDPRDVAAVIAWLCSDAARAVQGIGLPVTGRV